LGENPKDMTEVHAYEVHVREVPAHEVHVHELYAHEVHVQEAEVRRQERMTSNVFSSPHSEIDVNNPCVSREWPRYHQMR
jgi:hypothetical protein